MYEDYEFNGCYELLAYIEGMCEATQENNKAMKQVLDLIQNCKIVTTTTPDSGKGYKMDAQTVNWEDHRTGKAIDLISAFYDSLQKPYLPDQLEKSLDYLKTIRQLNPINSRQVAALALAYAHSLIQ